MNKKLLLAFLSFFLVLILAACSTVTKKEMILSSVDNATLTPQQVFVAQDKIFIYYLYEDALFYFTGTLPANTNPQEEVVYKNVDLSVQKDAPLVTQQLKVVFVDPNWKKILTILSKKYAPQEDNTGVVLSTTYKDIVLYKDSHGELKVEELKKIPKKITVVHTYSHEVVRADILAEIKKMLAQDYPGQHRFLLNLIGVPRMPFVYVDTNENIISSMILPNYYELKKEMSSIGFPIEFIYSFFIKSHFFAIIKSPFTSLHRLITTATKSLYVAFGPRVKSIEPPIPPVNENAQPMDIKEFEKYLDKKIRKDKYKAKVTLLIDGEEFFPHFMINAAKAENNIYVRLYIFSADPYGLEIADMLKTQSEHGVDVRVLIDELNTVLNWTKVPEQPTGKDYVMPSIKRYLKDGSKVSVRTHLNTWVTFDHSKVIVIDDKIAYTGGMNFGEDYRYLWHDMMVSLEGPFVLALKERFKYAWAFAGAGGDFSAASYAVFKEKHTFPDSDEPGMISVRPLYTRPSDSEIFKAQREAIRRSQKRIYIQNAYFSDNRIVDELIRARQRGVDVRIILPGKNDVSMMYKNNMVKTNLLIQNGIRVYEYPAMSHVKAALYDDFAVIGSSNFDKMSLFINQEMSLGISDPVFVKELEERLFEKDFAVSEEITEPFDVSWGYYLSAFFATQVG